MSNWHTAKSRPLPPNWKSIRRRILALAEERCEAIVNGVPCGEWANQVDHIRPRAQGGSDEDGNLMALCEQCHKLKTNQQPKNRMGYKSAAPKPTPGFYERPKYRR